MPRPAFSASKTAFLPTRISSAEGASRRSSCLPSRLKAALSSFAVRFFCFVSITLHHLLLFIQRASGFTMYLASHGSSSTRRSRIRSIMSRISHCAPGVVTRFS